MPADLFFAMVGMVTFAIGLRSALLHRAMLARIIAINVSGVGIFIIFVAAAYRGFEHLPDAVPHALVLTGIVVAVSATALALALLRHYQGIKDE